MHAAATAGNRFHRMISPNGIEYLLIFVKRVQQVEHNAEKVKCTQAVNHVFVKFLTGKVTSYASVIYARPQKCDAINERARSLVNRPAEAAAIKRNG
jgi:hypothetical protein